MKSSMKAEFQEEALNVILKAFHSEEETVSKDEVKALLGEDYNGFIQFMLDADLLELENEADVFYLSPMVYELLENKNLEYYLSALFNNEPNQIAFKNRVDDEGFPLLFDLRSINQQGGRSIYSTILIFALAMAGVMIVSNILMPTSSKEEEVSKVLSKEEQRILDSANAYLEQE